MYEGFSDQAAFFEDLISNPKGGFAQKVNAGVATEGHPYKTRREFLAY